MQLPLQITFRHMDPSPAPEARIRELTARLEKFSAQVASRFQDLVTGTEVRFAEEPGSLGPQASSVHVLS